MRLSGTRFVRIFQWIAPVLLTFLVVFGRGFFGAPMGWMALIGLFVGPVVALAMYIPSIIVVFDRDAKAARSTRLFYDIANWLTWAALLVLMFTLEDGGDSPPFGSVVSTWGMMSSDAAGSVFAVALIVAFLGWLGTIASAIVGVVDSRSTRGISCR
ncbi:MAG: hypothetical protein ACTH2E_08430 [Microbacterium sp.]